MKRRIFTILSAGSLVLWLITGALWALSLHRSFSWAPSSATGIYDLEIVNGHVAASRASIGTPPTAMSPSRPQASPPVSLAPSGTHWARFGFRWMSAWAESGLHLQGLEFPLWPVMLVTGILPVTWIMAFRRFHKRRRQKLGLCLHCAYDLRASKEKCPECGLAIPADLVRKPIA